MLSCQLTLPVLDAKSYIPSVYTYCSGLLINFRSMEILIFFFFLVQQCVLISKKDILSIATHVFVEDKVEKIIV